MSTKRILLPLLVALILMGCSSIPHQTENPNDVVAIKTVVDTFLSSILEKDKARFMSLFFSDRPEQIVWQAVVDDTSLEQIKSTNPKAIKARHRPDNNFVAFIDGIVASKVREEETSSDLKIDTDGEVASVSFDYVYISNGKSTNHGREKWLLVRTEQGWKIISVVYTIRLPKPQSGG